MQILYENIVAVACSRETVVTVFVTSFLYCCSCVETVVTVAAANRWMVSRKGPEVTIIERSIALRAKYHKEKEQINPCLEVHHPRNRGGDPEVLIQKKNIRTKHLI